MAIPLHKVSMYTVGRGSYLQEVGLTSSEKKIIINLCESA